MTKYSKQRFTKKFKGKEKATDPEADITSTSSISTAGEPSMPDKITLDDYDFEYISDNFYEPMVLGQALMLPSQALISSAANSSSSAVEPSSEAIKSSFETETFDKRAMTIKTTVQNIWKPEYLQHLNDLVDTTNLLVTRILPQQNSGWSKDSTKKHRRLISKYKEAHCEYNGYTPLRIPSFWKQTVRLLNKLFKKKEKANNLCGEMRAKEYNEKAMTKAVRKNGNQMNFTVAKKEMLEAGLYMTSLNQRETKDWSEF
ncbi:hypothetical protein INT48_008268 [Thamnidium elegans]|uniref:Uncharacterized protein n=1 Tax=Thamnidium elegans TaxID=101142 RepID=A0A8H7VWL3_9FUNG|nr:hypothetical protein INT48_008268 [Thamnidium elegans]